MAKGPHRHVGKKTCKKHKILLKRERPLPLRRCDAPENREWHKGAFEFITRASFGEKLKGLMLLARPGSTTFEEARSNLTHPMVGPCSKRPKGLTWSKAGSRPKGPRPIRLANGQAMLDRVERPHPANGRAMAKRPKAPSLGQRSRD